MKKGEEIMPRTKEANARIRQLNFNEHLLASMEFFGSHVEIECLFLPYEQLYLRFARNATVFGHVLAHFSTILANELWDLTKKRSGGWKKSPLRCHATLCERTDSRQALSSVAGFLRNGQ